MGFLLLELTWVLTLFPETLSADSINQGLIWAHMYKHGTDSKDPDIHVPDRWLLATKNTSSMHHPRWRNVTTPVVGLKNGHIWKNLTQNVERYSWENRRRKPGLPLLKQRPWPLSNGWNFWKLTIRKTRPGSKWFFFVFTANLGALLAPVGQKCKQLPV